MPEILEIEQYRRHAEPAVGRTIAAVAAPDGWYLKGGLDVRTVRRELTGRSILAARRRGKLLVLDTDGPRLGLRFGMTGRLLLDGGAAIERLEYSSDRNDPAWDRFGLTFTDGGSMLMRDPRRLGGVELDPDEDALGVDAWSIRPAQMRDALATSTTALKARLLDQSRIAGLGNLLVDEILWRSGLAPTRPARSLDANELRRLHRHRGRVLDQLFERGGSHCGDLHEHRRRGGTCPRDGSTLRRETVGGRTTYWCPAHQR
ncbi:MAG: formamidopyrimidine-DNA glycosylase, partial [Acidimicrobiales bacterium]|nr:formamidopyrimidine-DNA glycosylase [Acidimicrobiales bacterium]